MPKFRWNNATFRRNISILAIIALLGLVTLTSALYYGDFFQNNRLTYNSKAATIVSGQCNVNPTDKCSGGLFSREVCQFIKDGSGNTAWTPFTLSGSPNIRPDSYGNSGGEASIIKLDSTNGQPFTGGVYYTFNTVPGKTYCASWRWGPNTHDPAKPDPFGKTIGLDPTGNTNPQSNTIMWGNTEWRTARHLDYDLKADPNDVNVDNKIVATGNKMTIFLKADYNAKESSHLQIDMVNVYDEGTTAVPPTPTPTYNPIGQVNCPTTSTNTYAAGTITSAEAASDRAPADFHPDKNWSLRGYEMLPDQNILRNLVNNNDPNPDVLAPQLTTMTDNRTPAIFHGYRVFDWVWANAPNWGNRGAPLVNWEITAAGFYGNPGDKVYVPRSGREVAPGYEAYVSYAGVNPVSKLGTLTMIYLSEDSVKNGYTIQYDNLCIDPELLKLYQQLSPPNATNRTQLPRLKKGDQVGTFKTHEVVVAIRDRGQYMDPRSIAWWQGVTTLPEVPSPPPQCPVPSNTAGLQGVRNGNNINLAWNPNSTATKYTLWVDVKNKIDGTPDPWNGTCTSAAGDFCVDLAGTNNTTYSFAANPNQAYEWSLIAFNSCGQLTPVQTGGYIAAVVNPPTATPTSSLPPGCLPVDAPAGRDLVWSCIVGLASTADLTWQPIANATSYIVQVDNLSDPWDGSCTSPAGDVCADIADTKYSFDLKPGHTYAWSVQPRSDCTLGAKTAGATFRCSAPTPINSPTLIPTGNAPTAVPTSMNPPTNTPTPTPTPTATPTPAPRYADCNACGYCSTQTKQPGNYKECMKCLYPNMTEQETLAVDPVKNQPVPPATGKYYSQLGCIDVGAGGFKDPSAAGSVVNIILNRLLFPITGVLALLALIYGAFLLITGQDNPEQIARGKSWIYGGIIGVIFTFSAILIIRLIASDVLKIPGFDF